MYSLVILLIKFCVKKLILIRRNFENHLGPSASSDTQYSSITFFKVCSCYHEK